VNEWTGKERVLRAMEFKPTDRVPVAGGFVRHPDFLAGTAGVTIEEFWDDPRGVATRAFRKLGVDCVIGLILPSPGSPIGAEVEHRSQDRFDSPEAVVEAIDELPSLEELHREFDIEGEYETYLRTYREGEEVIGDDILWLPNGFRYVAKFQNEADFGAENYYMALALYPGQMRRYFEYSGEQAFLRNTAVARAIVDHDLPRVMWLGQDACDNRGPYIDPETMNEIYIRYVRRSLEPLKDIGVRIIWHSDGNIMPIVPYLLDAGVDGFQGLQETVETRVDIAELRSMTTRADRPPVIVGSVSTITTMPFGTPEEVRAEVRRCRNLADARGGGWILNFSSSVGPEVPAENLRAFFDAAHRHSHSSSSFRPPPRAAPSG
jgi:hypothetical protein